mgnify:CR=1 FL=1
MFLVFETTELTVYFIETKLSNLINREYTELRILSVCVLCYISLDLLEQNLWTQLDQFSFVNTDTMIRLTSSIKSELGKELCQNVSKN